METNWILRRLYGKRENKGSKRALKVERYYRKTTAM